MGCDSPDSNFNNMTFGDGKWWCSSGWDDSWTGPLAEIEKQLGERLTAFDLARNENGTWTAKPKPPPPEPKFEQLPDEVEVEIDGRPREVSAMNSVWAGSRFIRVTNIDNCGLWHQPIIAVGSHVVWHGTPLQEPAAADAAARKRLAEFIQGLVTSHQRLRW